MLEFCKEILTKVSFDRSLFQKELRKAIKWLKGDELKQLRAWCFRKFGGQYTDIIVSSFQPAL